MIAILPKCCWLRSFSLQIGSRPRGGPGASRPQARLLASHGTKRYALAMAPIILDSILQISKGLIGGNCVAVMVVFCLQPQVDSAKVTLGSLGRGKQRWQLDVAAARTFERRIFFTLCFLNFTVPLQDRLFHYLADHCSPALTAGVWYVLSYNSFILLILLFGMEGLRRWLAHVGTPVPAARPPAMGAEIRPLIWPAAWWAYLVGIFIHIGRDAPKIPYDAIYPTVNAIVFFPLMALVWWPLRPLPLWPPWRLPPPPPLGGLTLSRAVVAIVLQTSMWLLQIRWLDA